MPAQSGTSSGSATPNASRSAASDQHGVRADPEEQRADNRQDRDHEPGDQARGVAGGRLDGRCRSPPASHCPIELAPPLPLLPAPMPAPVSSPVPEAAAGLEPGVGQLGAIDELLRVEGFSIAAARSSGVLAGE